MLEKDILACLDRLVRPGLLNYTMELDEIVIPFADLEQIAVMSDTREDFLTLDIDDVTASLGSAELSISIEPSGLSNDLACNEFRIEAQQSRSCGIERIYYSSLLQDTNTRSSRVVRAKNLFMLDSPPVVTIK